MNQKRIHPATDDKMVGDYDQEDSDAFDKRM